MFINKNPKKEILQKLFSYNEDGFLIWNDRSIEDFEHRAKSKAIHASWNSRFAGTKAGSIDKKGYFQISLSDKNKRTGYKLHRLIWSWHYGEIQEGMQIDHIDCDTSNNRIENLRIAEHGQNRSNSKCNSNSTTGIKGIAFHKKCNKWQARVQKDNVRLEKFFDDIDSANNWLRNQRAGNHKEFTNHGSA